MYVIPKTTTTTAAPTAPRTVTTLVADCQSLPNENAMRACLNDRITYMEHETGQTRQQIQDFQSAYNQRKARYDALLSLLQRQSG
jgi:hypothetical protein